MIRLLTLLLLIAPVHATSFHVSPDGKNSNDGGTNAPFASFHRALEAVAALPRPWTSDVVIKAAPGDYFLESTLKLGPEHSGDGKHRLIIRSAGPTGSATLVGGMKLDPRRWRRADGGIFYQDLAEVDRVDILYENRIKGRKARFPNHESLKDFPVADGRYFISGQVGTTEPWLTAEAKDLSVEELSKLNQDVKAATESYLVVWGHGSCDWHKWIYAITHTEPKIGRIHISEKNPILHQGAKRKGCRYYIEGGLRYLDAPREFHFDRTNKRLYYMPDGVGGGEVIIGTLNKVIHARKAKNVSLEGIRVTCSDVLSHTPSAFPWVDLEAALLIEHSLSISVKDCRFDSIGQSAIQLHHSDNNRIENTWISRVGHSGIRMLYSDGNTVHNCLIHDIGLRRVFSEGLGIYKSKNNTATHLEIFNSARYGVTLRGMVGDLGVEVHPTTNNRCEYIKVYNVNQDSGDSGGIHMARVNRENGESYINHYNQITVFRSMAQPQLTEEFPPTGVYLDYKKSCMNQSLSNIEVRHYDPRYPGYTVKRFNGMYGDKDRTSAKQKQIMQNRPWNNDSSTKANCSWQDDFDPKHMEYDKIGLTAGFPVTYRRLSKAER